MDRERNPDEHTPESDLMSYNPFRRFKRQELRDELDLLITRQLNGVIRGEIGSDEARTRFFSRLKGSFRSRRQLRYRKEFQRRLLMAVLGGLPNPGEDDKEAVVIYLRNRVLRGSLSLADARERLLHAAHLLPEDERKRWVAALETALTGQAARI